MGLGATLHSWVIIRPNDSGDVSIEERVCPPMLSTTAVVTLLVCMEDVWYLIIDEISQVRNKLPHNPRF